MSEKELFERACRAWAARCQKENWIPDQPGEIASEVDLDTGIVKLRNCNSVLAVYRYYPASDRLRRVEVDEEAEQRRRQMQREGRKA